MGLFTKSKTIEAMEQRLADLEAENQHLKHAMGEIAKNIEAVDALIKIVMYAQQQVAFDVSTIYDALQQIAGVTATKGAVDPLDEYLVKVNPWGTDDDDGGLLN